MKHFLSFFAVLFLSTSFVYSNEVDPDPDKSNWGYDPNKSLVSAPELSCDEFNLTIFSEKSLPALYVYIVNAQGAVVYANLHSIGSESSESISISMLSEGLYTVYLYSGSNYLAASLAIQ